MKIKVQARRGGKGATSYYIRIPKPLYEVLGKPRYFEMQLEGEKIILDPLKEFKENEG